MWRKFSLQFAPCTLQCSGLAARQKFKRTPEEEWFVDRKFLQWAELVMVMSVEKPSKMAKYWEWNLGATISRTTSRPKKLVKLFWIFCIKIILSENGKHPKKFHIIDSFLATSFFLHGLGLILGTRKSDFLVSNTSLSQALIGYCWRCGRLCHRSTQKHQVISQIFSSKSIVDAGAQ